MLKNIGRGAFLGLSAVLLSACQHTQRAVDTMAIKFIAPEQRPANVKLYCTGTPIANLNALIIFKLWMTQHIW